MSNLATRYLVCFRDRRFVRSLIITFILLGLSVAANYYAAVYATSHASNYVDDIVLSNTRSYDVDNFFVYGPVLMWFVAAFIMLSDPKKIPFTLKSVALLVFIRSIFVTLTHIGPYPTHIIISSSSLLVDVIGGKMFFAFFTGGDFFFSGHTALPFLLGLVFWQDKFWRYFFIICSVIFGAMVLAAHLHYTIDVVSAFFITYAIYHLALYFFSQDRLAFAPTSS